MLIVGTFNLSQISPIVNRQIGSKPFCKRKNSMLMKVSEVAKYLKVRNETVYGWIKQGKLACIHLDKAIRIDERDLADFIAKHRKDAKHENH